jgi:NADPH-dependent 2,4-dienoyl-CoA reductase/sulfur reductase-like enzyme
MTENQTEQIVVVGASAAGLRAAARARRRLPNARIIVIDRSKFISYAACGMPYFVSGDIESADKLRETPYGLIRD